MMRWTDRKYYSLTAVLCVIAMAIVLYLQFGQGLLPCPLCVFQRIAVILMLIFAVLGLIFAFKRTWRNIWYILLCLSELFGLFTAGRQVGLQHLPPGQITTCGPGLNMMLKEFPLNKVIVEVFKGSGDCAVVHMRVLGFDIAEWSLLFFAILLVITILSFCGAHKRL